MAALGGDTGGLHPAGSTADHEHMAGPDSGQDSRDRFKTGLGGHGTFDPLIDENLAHAGVAVDAGPDLLGSVFDQLDRQIRVSQQFARHRDELEFAALNGQAGIFGFDPTCADHRHIDCCLHRPGIVDKAVGLLHQRCFGKRAARGDGGISRDTDGRSACCCGQFGSGNAIGQRDAARRSQLLAIEPDPDREIGSDALLDCGQGLEKQACAIFQRATVLVLALVVVRREESRQDISMGGVQFDAVKAGGLGARCSRGEILDHLLNVGLVHDADAGLGAAHAADEIGHLGIGQGAQKIALASRR